MPIPSGLVRSSERTNRLRSAFSDRYVIRSTRLAFLAPEIVEAIVAGDQPPELTAETLAERIDLPLLWTAQEQALGICVEQRFE